MGIGRTGMICLALAASGCLTAPARDGTGFRAVRTDHNSYRAPSLILDRYDRYPAERARVEYLHWMYNAPVVHMPTAAPTALPPGP